MITLSSYRPDFSLRASLFLLITLCASVGVTRAQTPEPQVTSSQIRIAQDLETIHIADEPHRPPA